jgi:pyrroline-5-carboxylate reductase
MMSGDLVGFVGGGQMAQALALGAIQAGVLVAQNLVIAEPNRKQQSILKEKLPGAEIIGDSESVFRKCQRIVLAVKPHVLKEISSELSAYVTQDHLLVSIAAGISLEDLQANLATPRIVRVMPNTPAQVGAGAAAISTSDNVDERDVVWVEQLMNSVGTSVRVPDHLMHAVVGVAGSSPAYIYMVIEAMSDGGVAMGLPRDIATRLSAQAVLGAAKMVLETGLHPGALKDQVTSPGGTTIAAIRELEAAGVRGAFIEAVARCAERSSELG